MTSPDPKSSTGASEGGGMLPALLAGAGILLVAGLFVFGGDDETAKEAKDPKAASANARTAKGTNPGVAARPADDATVTSAKPRLNPKIANSIVTGGMAPTTGKKPEPTSFESTAAEIDYWEDELDAAEKMLATRERSAEYAPKQEEQIRQTGTAQDLEQFQARLVVVADNLEKAKARVEEVEAKLKALKGE